MVGEQKPQPDEADFHAFADLIPQIVWKADANGTCVYFNCCWYEYTGLTPEKSIGTAWYAVLHVDERLTCIERWNRAVESGHPFETELRLCDAQSQYRWFLARAKPQRNPEGGVVSWVGTLTDIDRQKTNQEELHCGETQFRLLAEAIPEVVWMADSQGAIRFLNHQWFQQTGLIFEQSDRWQWLLAVHPDDRQFARVQWAQAVNLGIPFEIEQRLLRATDHCHRWHLVRGTPILDQFGVIVQWVGTMTDIDVQRREAKLLEHLVRERTAELERSNSQLEEFATVASHDLQEPLRKIEAFGERLQVKCSSELGKQGKENLERILKSAARMRTLINDLLAFSRITTKLRTFMRVDLASVASEVVSDLEGLIQQTGGTVEINELPSIVADPLQIRQLFQNLIVNGLKFHHPGTAPVVSLSARPVPGPDGMKDLPSTGWHEIAVQDNGIGFAEIHADQIFQVFQRLHGRKEYEGTGMGLAICRKIVERHKGRITARSKPGLGSTFLVVLPADLHD